MIYVKAMVGLRHLSHPTTRNPMARIIGIGTEITECLRIARMIERHGEQFIDRVYTAAEVRYCQDRPQSTQHFADRWAAKQAILKALGIGAGQRVAWTDIEIRRDPSGRPAVAVRGRDQGPARTAARVRGLGHLLPLPHARHRVCDCAREGGIGEGCEVIDFLPATRRQPGDMG